MVLIPVLLIVLAFNGGLYLGTILFSAYKAEMKSQLLLSENGLTRFC